MISTQRGQALPTEWASNSTPISPHRNNTFNRKKVGKDSSASGLLKIEQTPSIVLSWHQANTHLLKLSKMQRLTISSRKSLSTLSTMKTSRAGLFICSEAFKCLFKIPSVPCLKTTGQQSKQERETKFANSKINRRIPPSSSQPRERHSTCLS